MNAAPVTVILFAFGASFVALVGKIVPGRFWRELSLLVLAGALWPLATAAPVVFGGGEILYALGGFSGELGIPLLLDGLAWFSAALVVLMTLIVGMVALPHRGYPAAFFFFLHMTSAGMLAVAITADVFTLFVSFEIVAIGVYVLIAWERTPEGLLASLKYLFLSSVGILFFLLGVFLVYRDLGALSFRGISSALTLASPVMEGVSVGPLHIPPPGPARSIPLAVAALCVGIGVRTAFIPFHTWLPEAHAWAPHPVSALLSGVLIKISFIAMVRLIVVFDARYLEPVLMWIGVATAVLAVVWALAQHDAKRLLAFHSISQMGYILAAWGSGGTGAEVAAYSHALSHALFKALLFIVVGIMIERSGTRSVYRMRGGATGSPFLALGLLVGALAISGVPPFNGFASKKLVLSAVGAASSAAEFLLNLAAVGTAASFMKLSMVLRPADTTPPDRGRLPAVEGAAVGVLVILVVAGGVFSGPTGRSIATLVGAPEPGGVYTTSAIPSTVIPLVVGVAVAAMVVSRRGRRIAHRVSSLAPQLDTVLVFFVLGLTLFSLVPFWRV